MKLGIIGAGKLGQAILKGWLDAKAVKPHNVWAITSSPDSAKKVAKKFKISCRTKLEKKLLEKTDLLLIATKPNHLSDVITELKAAGLTKKTLVVSVLAGILPHDIEKSFQTNNPIIVAMTNTPAAVKQAMTTLYAGRNTKKFHLKTVVELFSKIGLVSIRSSEEFHLLTALTASAPAFIFYWIRSISLAAQRMGLSEQDAEAMTIQTFLGASTLAKLSKDSMLNLINQVATPGGCTREGLKVLENSPTDSIMYDLLKATIARSKTLSPQF